MCEKRDQRVPWSLGGERIDKHFDGRCDMHSLSWGRQAAVRILKSGMRANERIYSPGCAGKSTYCNAMYEHGQAAKRTFRIVNMDPAAEHFKYPVDIDIRELISLDGMPASQSERARADRVVCECTHASPGCRTLKAPERWHVLACAVGCLAHDHV